MNQTAGALPSPPTWLTCSIAFACLVAVLDLPYGFYQFLRLVVTAYTGYLAFRYFREGQSGIGWAFAFIALLYNPVFVIAMSKGMHAVFNLITVALILSELLIIRDRPVASDGDPLEAGAIKHTTESDRSEREELAKFIARELVIVVFAIIAFGLVLSLALWANEKAGWW